MVKETGRVAAEGSRARPAAEEEGVYWQPAGGWVGGSVRWIATGKEWPEANMQTGFGGYACARTGDDQQEFANKEGEEDRVRGSPSWACP